MTRFLSVQIRRVAGLPLAFALCACSEGAGEGTKPVELFLGVGTRSASVELSECGSASLSAYVVFDGENGTSVGDYTGRALMASDDPATVFISDGITPSPAGTVHAAGTVLGLRPGVAIIHASYLDFVADISVAVRPLSALKIEPALSHVAENLPQKFDLIARSGETLPEQDVSSLASWSFEPPTARASVGAEGAVQANSARAGEDDETLSLVARLPECGRLIEHQFRVAPVAGIELEYEFGDETLLPLATSESIRVYARFADQGAARQNLSAAAELSDVPDELLNVQQDGDAIYVGTLEETGSAGFTLEVSSGAGFSMPTKTWSLQDRTLHHVDITPSILALRYPDEGQLHAIGTFTDGTQRDITRHVAWASLDSEALSVSSAQSDAGLVTVLDLDRDVSVEASSEAAEDSTPGSATVKIFSSTSNP